MKKIEKRVLSMLVLIVAIGIYYYIALPAINIHSTSFWYFLIFVIGAFIFIYMWRKKIQKDEIKQFKVLKISVTILGVIVVVYLIGTILSSPIVNASRYQQLMKVEKSVFEEDIQEVSYDQIPLLDRESATLIGNRKMGSMVDMVSQFEVDNIYTKINYQNQPVRVSPLRYASGIKWLTNQSKGIPAYIKIDMATQTANLVKLDASIKYSESEYFNRNIHRYLRFNYPTYMFNDLSFEIDDNGVPYWVCPVKKFNIGLFGGVTIGRTVLCNAVTGELTDYAIEDVPRWVDRVYSADLLVQLYDYYGSLKHGFLNSVLGQKDCLQTTNGYNYLAIDDDVWVYTGVTSVNSDQSSVGFMLMNQRTMESKFFPVEGAVEESAMSSAEGKVQEKNYIATFPLLINVAGTPTYLMALKDEAGLVKKYAMVNVQKYQLVAIGDLVSDCEAEYKKLMLDNGIIKKEKDTRETLTKTGVITKIAQGVVDGNSHYYIMMKDSDAIFDISVVSFLDIIKYEVGDTITLEYKVDKESNIVLGID